MRANIVKDCRGRRRKKTFNKANRRVNFLKEIYGVTASEIGRFKKDKHIDIVSKKSTDSHHSLKTKCKYGDRRNMANAKEQMLNYTQCD